jgi:glycosyltransferase involved in cell wall biosynthesis
VVLNDGVEPTTSGDRPFVFIHSSDELYGADRILLELVSAVPASIPVEVWLPQDLPHPAMPLCEELQRRGVRVRHLDLPVLRRAYQNPRGLIGLLAKAARLFRSVRAVRPSTVYCTTSAVFLAAPVARAARVPRVVGHVQEIWGRTDRLALTGPAVSCHQLVAISTAVVAPLPNRVQRRATVVANATPPPEHVEPLAGRSGPLEFLVASRWNGWKGHRTLLRAWDRLDDPGRLVILGAKPPSGESVDVEAIVAALRRPDSVTIVGEVADSATYVEAADVVIMPSDQPEPFGLVAIEAFARARPVIASAGGGLLDIVTADSDGWLYPLRDDVALAAVLSGLTRERVAEAGAEARRTYERRYTVERYARQWRSALGL